MSGGYGELSMFEENVAQLHDLFPFPGEVADVRYFDEVDISDALVTIDPRNSYGYLYAYYLYTLDNRKFIYFSDADLASVLKIVAESDYVEAYDCDHSYEVGAVSVMGRSIVTVTAYDEYVDEMLYRYQDTLMVEYLYDLLSQEKFTLRMKWLFGLRMTDVGSWEELRTYLDLRYVLKATFTTSMMLELYDVSKAKKQRTGM